MHTFIHLMVNQFDDEEKNGPGHTHSNIRSEANKSRAREKTISLTEIHDTTYEFPFMVMTLMTLSLMIFFAAATFFLLSTLGLSACVGMSHTLKLILKCPAR